MRGLRLAASVGVLVTAAVCLPAAGALADSGPPPPNISLVQSLGGHELTFVIHPVIGLPAPLQVDVISHADQPDATLRLHAAPVGSATGGSDGEVKVGGPPTSHPVVLTVDRAGGWELRVSAGDDIALLPFTIPPPVIPAWEMVTYGGLGAAGVLMLAALGTAVLSKSRRMWISATLSGAACVALAAGVTAALLSPQLPAAPPRLTGMASSYANLTLDTEPANPIAGQPFTLHVHLFDGATGRVVDDLQPEHGALIHLVVVDEHRKSFRHLHPARVGAGEFQVRVDVSDPGAYTAYVELQRQGAGVQLPRAAFAVAPGSGSPSAEPPAPGLDPREVDGLRFTAHAPALKAGAATTIEVEIADTAGPVRDLQPWLGMNGHLVLLNDTIFGHVHELDSMSSMATMNLPDETVAGYGPKLRFVTSFPQPGRYWLWLQVERGFTVTTVPYVVEVAA